MQTLRLFAYQRPSRVKALLESLVQSRDLIPDNARQVCDRSELPSVLQKIVFNAQKNGRAWSAWTAGVRIWLFVAEMSLAPSRERGQPTLQVDLFREDGMLRQHATWICLNDGTWQQCAV